MNRIPRLRVHYYDEAREPDVILVGSWELALSERKYGPAAVRGEIYEASLYQAYLGAKRAGILDSERESFDQWAPRIALIEEAAEGESQPPLGQ